jgi:hypothetical protein
MKKILLIIITFVGASIVYQRVAGNKLQEITTEIKISAQ